MVLFIKNIYQKNNMKRYLLLFFLIFFSLMFLLITIMDLDKHDKDELNKEDNLLVEVLDYKKIDFFDNIKDKIKYLYIKDIYNYIVIIDINNCYQLKDNEVILYSNNKINIDNYNIKEYYKSDKEAIIINRNLIKEREFSYQIMAKDYNNKLSIIDYLTNQNLEVINHITYTPTNIVKTYTIIFIIICIFLIIFSIIIIFMFNKDDLKINNLLRIVGYTSNKLLLLSYLSFIIILTILYLISLLINIFISLIMRYNIEYLKVFMNILFLYFIINIIILIIYKIFYMIYYRKINLNNL